MSFIALVQHLRIPPSPSLVQVVRAGFSGHCSQSQTSETQEQKKCQNGYTNSVEQRPISEGFENQCMPRKKSGVVMLQTISSFEFITEMKLPSDAGSNPARVIIHLSINRCKMFLGNSTFGYKQFSGRKQMNVSSMEQWQSQRTLKPFRPHRHVKCPKHVCGAVVI